MDSGFHPEMATMINEEYQSTMEKFGRSVHHSHLFETLPLSATIVSLLHLESPTMTTSRDNALLILVGAMAGAGIVLGWQKLAPPRKVDPETDYTMGHQLVWKSIGGAMNAAMVYTGDRLHLYEALRELCEKPGSSATAIDLAQHTVRRLG